MSKVDLAQSPQVTIIRKLTHDKRKDPDWLRTRVSLGGERLLLDLIDLAKVERDHHPGVVADIIAVAEGFAAVLDQLEAS